MVKYGIDSNQLNQFAFGDCNVFIDGGPKHRKHYIHRVRLSNLKSSTRYCQWYLYDNEIIFIIIFY